MKVQPGQAEACTRSADGLKQIVATLSHELRTPLNAIVGAISLLERRLPEGSQDRVHVDRLKRNSRHLASMLEDVLDVLRAESGQFTLSAAAHSLRRAVDEALADVELCAGERGVAIVDAVPGDEPDCGYWGDDRRVRQILVNLFTNAIKFTAPGGRLMIAGGLSGTTAGAQAGRGPWAFVRVADTGRGIPAADLARVFEPFEQVDPADRVRGEGLGLSISRQLARRMNGDITVSSEPGVGSSFVLWLPAAGRRGR